MVTDYHQRLRPVIRYLEQHFCDLRSLDEIAAMANLSPFHFHRIFKAVTGEPLNEYLRRLRLEAAAHQLFYQKQSVTEVALNVGFSSSQSLAKAFRLRFGISPSQMRHCDQMETFTEMMRRSKIGHQLRKAGHAGHSTKDYADWRQSSFRSTKMKIETFPAGYLAFIRITGPYGQGYEPVCNQLYGYAQRHNLMQAPWLFIYHDNPEVTPSERCRTDVCILLSEKPATEAGIEVCDFMGGRYATHRQQVEAHAQYAEGWQQLIGEIVAQKLSCDESRPCFELYHSMDPQTGVADVSFCSAISE
ncbi:DNA gyrase inhibitor [Vibrio stylophorae]|uniref:DNA gyrase inhibitor n=1 Tax=Vibrio stylophorae TaxID=659351 RepID=A0ABN8DVZ4_9VIBR|nr:helix-turn-helix domain-containing protein [Vibrio stylophorae]CAH0533995.1 DNA gyrase inhibitor [Vibrio stylophorae]